MSLFSVGQLVHLASNSAIIFEIIRINQDQTFDIQVQCSASDHLKYNHVCAEMLKLVES